MPIKKMYESKHRVAIMIASSFALLAIVSASLIFFMRDIRFSQDKVIVQHLKQLKQIFDEIDRTCRIVDFDHEKNFVDFLNVGSFSGSEVGSMNLMYPKKWNGPYLETNLTVQEKPYMIVKTYRGWYIMPADGVRLGNGKTIGKDLAITHKTDLEALKNDPSALASRHGELAIALRQESPEAIVVDTSDEID